MADDSPIAGRVVRKNKEKTNEMFKKGFDTKGKLIPRKVSRAGDTKRRKFVTPMEDVQEEEEIERKKRQRRQWRKLWP